MKKGLIYALLALFVAFFTTVSGRAQETVTGSIDREIEITEKKLWELKKRKREEIERKIKALKDELDRLEQPAAAPPQGQPNLSPPASTDSLTEAPKLAIPSQLLGNGTGTGSVAPSTGMVAPSTGTVAPALRTNRLSAGQVDTKCMLVLQQPANYSRADVSVCSLADSIVEKRMLGVTPSGIDLTSDQGLLLPALFGQVSRKVAVDAAVKSFVVDIEASRADKQFGADPKSAGTTSLAVKGGIPTVLSWAVENGAAVSSSSGTTLTFRVNPVGLGEALAGQGYITGFRNTQDDALLNAFRKTSVGFSFDTTRGTESPLFVGSKQQLSALSFRYQFVNQRDPRHTRYQALWDEFFQNQGLAFTKLQSDRLKELENESAEATFRNQNLQRWLEQTNSALGTTTIVATQATKIAATEEVRKILEKQLSELPTSELEKDPALIKALSDFIGAYLPYLAEKKKIMEQIAKGTLVTFEYTNYREPTAPDLSNLRFIAEKGILGGFDITANASLTFFNKRPAGANFKRIRDFDFSLQLDKKLDDVMGLGASTLSFTGKFQRLTSDAVAFDGTVLPGVQGDIAAGQIKLMIPLKDTGLKIPFSLTFANRTELIREREVRANFGFTFDLDTIFAKFKPF